MTLIVVLHYKPKKENRGKQGIKNHRKWQPEISESYYKTVI